MTQPLSSCSPARVVASTAATKAPKSSNKDNRMHTSGSRRDGRMEDRVPNWVEGVFSYSIPNLPHITRQSFDNPADARDRLKDPKGVNAAALRRWCREPIPCASP
eukprot:7978720-Prorocentrum_lima.AAC.1